MRKAGLALAVSVVAVSVVGLSVAVGPSRADNPKPKLRHDTTVAYASTVKHATTTTNLSTEAAMQQVLNGLDKSVFAKAWIGSSPTSQDWQGMWFYADVRVRSVTSGQYLRAAWQAELAQGGLADLLNSSRQANTANVIVGSTITAIFPDGRSRQVAGGAGDVSSGQIFASPDVKTARNTTASVLKAYGLNLMSVQTWHPLGEAISVIASAPSMQRLSGKLDELMTALEGSPARYDGVYLEIRNSHGVPSVMSSTALRVGAGSLWIRPGLGVDLGTMHG